jgi:acyl carrier protein
VPEVSQDVESILIDRLAKGRDCSADDVKIELEQTGKIDSLEGLVLAIEAERTYGISIPDEELEVACRSIPDWVQLIRSKLQPEGGGGEQ